MEEPSVHENGENLPGSDVKSEWMDIGDFSNLVCELKATVTLAEEWIIIQHSKFDLSIESEPYHASQVLVNQKTKEFLIRVWGKTFKKGLIASITDLQDICKSALGTEATCCPGHYSGNMATLFGNMPSFKRVSHPFMRWVSSDCQVLYEKRDASESQVKLCTSCSSMKQEAEDQPGEYPVKQEVKEYMAPSDFLEMDVHEYPEEPPYEPDINELMSLPRKRFKFKGKKKESSTDKTKCEFCGEEFKYSFQMRAHLIKEHQWGIFTCQVCLYVLFHPDELSKHLFEEHGDMAGGIFANCPACKQELFLEGMTTLATHYMECSQIPDNKRKKPEKKKTKIVCETCGVEVVCKAKLIEHMYLHTGERPHKCELAGCDKAFRTKSELKTHKERHERQLQGLPPPKKFMCDLCGKAFEARCYLKAHVAVTHEKKSMDIKCTECHLVFPLRNHMLWHRNLVHFPDKYKCAICSKTFGSSTQLKKHSKVHDPVGKFECEMCGTRLKSKCSLVEHMRVHRGEKPYPCPYCDYRGSSSSLLNHHKRRAHVAEFDMEKKEKERKRIKVSAEVQQKVAEEAGVKLGGLDPVTGNVIPDEHPPSVQSPMSAMTDDAASVMSPESVALDLGMQPHHQQLAAHHPHASLPPRPQMLPGPNPFGISGYPFPDGFPRPPFGR